MKEKNEIVFTVAYNESGNIVEVRAPAEYKVTGPIAFSPQEPYSIPATYLLHANSTIVVHVMSNPNWWYIIDPATGQLTMVCE